MISRSGQFDQVRGTRRARDGRAGRLPAPPDLYGAFPVKGLSPWLGSRSADCSFGFADSSLFGAGKAVLRPVACDQVPGARGRGQGTETLAQLGGMPPSVACVSQRLD